MIKWIKSDPWFNSIMLGVFLVFGLPMLTITAIMAWTLLWAMITGSGALV